MQQSTVEKPQLGTEEGAQTEQTDGKQAASSETQVTRLEPEQSGATQPAADQADPKGSEGKPAQVPQAVGEQGKHSEHTEGNQLADKDAQATQVVASQVADKDKDAQEAVQLQKHTVQVDDDGEDDVEDQQLLKDIENQCVSHGRHPGEWDNIKHQWEDEVRCWSLP